MEQTVEQRVEQLEYSVKRIEALMASDYISVVKSLKSEAVRFQDFQRAYILRNAEKALRELEDKPRADSESVRIESAPLTEAKPIEFKAGDTVEITEDCKSSGGVPLPKGMRSKFLRVLGETYAVLGENYAVVEERIVGDAPTSDWPIAHLRKIEPEEVIEFNQVWKKGWKARRTKLNNGGLAKVGTVATILSDSPDEDGMIRVMLPNGTEDQWYDEFCDIYEAPPEPVKVWPYEGAEGFRVDFGGGVVRFIIQGGYWSLEKVQALSDRGLAFETEAELLEAE